MDPFFHVFKSVANIFITICNLEFSIFGYTVTYGEAFIYFFIISFLAWFLHYLIS